MNDSNNANKNDYGNNGINGFTRQNIFINQMAESKLEPKSHSKESLPQQLFTIKPEEILSNNGVIVNLEETQEKRI